MRDWDLFKSEQGVEGYNGYRPIVIESGDTFGWTKG